MADPNPRRTLTPLSSELQPRAEPKPPRFRVPNLPRLPVAKTWRGAALRALAIALPIILVVDGAMYGIAVAVAHSDRGRSLILFVAAGMAAGGAVAALEPVTTRLHGQGERNRMMAWTPFYLVLAASLAALATLFDTA